VLREPFVVLGESVAPADPRQGAFDAHRRGRTSTIEGIAIRARFRTGRPPSRSWTLAAITRTTTSSPRAVGPDVTLVPVGLLACVIAARVVADGVGALERLGVHDPGRGHRIPAHLVADRSTQRVGIRSVVPSAFHRSKYQ
jgi:hypothetical protein